MLDTVKLSIVDFKVDMQKLEKATEYGGIDFRVKPYTLDAHDIMGKKTELKPASLLFKDCSNISVYGSKAFLNTPKWNLDIHNGLAVVQFSSPKVIGENNYYTSTKAEFEKSLSIVESQMEKTGIHCNLKNANLCRIDLTKTIETKYSFSQYMPVLQMLDGKRAKDKRQYQAQTMLYGNSLIQACLYNKIAEMNYHKENVTGYPPKSFRAELRLMKRKKITSMLGIEKASDLHKNWNDIKQARKDILKDFVFRINPKDFSEKILLSAESAIDSYMDIGGRNWFDLLCRELGLTRLLEMVDVQTLMELYRMKLLQNGNTAKSAKEQVSRMKKKIGSSMHRVMEYLQIESIPYSQLYEELYSKLVA